MAAFVNLEDSPMFHKQISSLEQGVTELRDRCQKLYKGCNVFMTALGEACSAYNTFADALEAFGGDHDDPISVSIGGPIISKFVNTVRELATYKEFLRSQVEHVLVDRLMHFLDVDLNDAKESRRQLDRAGHVYDQSREKFVSLKKNAREDVVEELEEDLKNSKSAFERSRFNLVNALMNIEAKRKYEFLDSVSAVTYAHLRYFKLGHELFSQMEPYINQVLAVAQHSREQANVEQDKLARRIQQYRTQEEMDNMRTSSCLEPAINTEGSNLLDAAKAFESFSPFAAKEEVQTVKQGYLLKRSSNLRGDWKRRFFVLNSHGGFYYYRSSSSKSLRAQHQLSNESSSGVFSRFRSKHSRSLSRTGGSVDFQALDLQTSKLKMDADDIDLRLCFRIITPMKTYTLQAESAGDRMDWVNKLTGAISSLLTSNIFNQENKGMKTVKSLESVKIDSSGEFPDEEDSSFDGALRVMREIPGNDLCAECSTSNPEWASLNLGILLCIECSGAHRNLGVHISKVRSLTLDVKVWEPTVIDLFRGLGNTFCNSIWEGMLLMTNERAAESNTTVPSITKPCPRDSFYEKEKFIHSKYVDKKLVIKEQCTSDISQLARIAEAVKKSNLRDVYRLLVISDGSIVNSILSESEALDPTSCPKKSDSESPELCLEGWSLLHLACHVGNVAIVELLLQFGADVNHYDLQRRTPLHHCVCRKDYPMAKFLLKRGASASVKDAGGLSVLERAMEMGAITDEELFIMLTEA